MSLTFSQKEQQHTNLVRTTLDNFVILSEGNIKDVKHIIKYYGIDFIDAEGSTFLHHANASNAAYLLSNGFTPLLDSVNNRNQTALFGSCAEKTELLLRYGANINHLDLYNENALFMTQKMDVVDLLLEKSIDCTVLNKEKSTLLFSADKKKAEKLLKHADIEINHRNEYGDNALLYQDLESLIYYISKGMDIHNINNKGDNLLLSIMLFENFIDDEKRDNLNEHMSSSGINSEMTEKIAYLIKAGISPYTKNKEGYCASDFFNGELIALTNKLFLSEIINETSVSYNKSRL